VEFALEHVSLVLEVCLEDLLVEELFLVGLGALGLLVDAVVELLLFELQHLDLLKEGGFVGGGY
jgi:hypothetical protein